MKLLEISMTAPFEKKMPGPSIHTTVSGHVTLAVGKEDGSSHEVRADFPNMVLDSGLDLFARDGWSGQSVYYAHAGSSGAAVDAAQRGVLAPLGVGYRSAITYEVVSVDPFSVEQTTTYRFSAGSAQGNVAEIGFGSSDRRDYSNYPLFSRALVLDVFGSPSAVTVLADEYLDVTYVVTLTADVTDVPFTMNLSTGSVSGVLRRADLYKLGSTSSYALEAFSYVPGPPYEVSDGTIGPSSENITTGTQKINANGSRMWRDYVPGTFYRDSDLKLDVQQGNLPSGGFSAMWLYQRGYASFQMSFDPPVPKTAERVFTFGIRLSVGRG